MFFEQSQAGISRRAPPLVIVLIFLCGTLLGKPPTIKTILPLAAVPGKITEVVIEGRHLEKVTGLWTTFDSKISLIEGEKREGNRLRLRIDIPPETPVGIGAIRVAGPGGLSNLALFLIDDLAVRTVSEGNTSASTAISLEPPCAIDSQATAEHRDFYSFKARAGQSLSFEVMSQRIGSALDPILRILDADGRELAFSDDAAGADSRLAWRSEKDGEYLIELRDITYRGGESFSYRLRVGDFPLVSAPYPMRAEQAKTTKVAIAGESSAGVEPREVQLPGDSHGRAFSLAARWLSWAWIAFSIKETSRTFPLGTWLKILRYQWTIQRCQSASG